MDETFANIAATHSCRDAIEEAVGFDLPSSTKEKFMRLAISMHSSRNSPNLKRLTIKGGSREDYLARLNNARGYVEEGLAAAYYHYSNVEALERKAIEFALQMAPPIPGKYGGGYGFNASRKFSFEYIAFAFALRRTMDYLAVSVAAFFRNGRDWITFRGLNDAIKRHDPKDIRYRIQEKHKGYMETLSDIIAKEHGDDARSKFAHQRARSSFLNLNYTEEGKLTNGLA